MCTWYSCSNRNLVDVVQFRVIEIADNAFKGCRYLFPVRVLECQSCQVYLMAYHKIVTRSAVKLRLSARVVLMPQLPK